MLDDERSISVALALDVPTRALCAAVGFCILHPGHFLKGKQES